jgi:hypothetical protein
VITQDDFVALFNKQNKHKTNIDEMFQVLIQHVDEDSVFCFWEDYLVNSSMEEDDFQSVELYARHGRGKPRYIPSQEELLEYEDPEHYEDTPQIQALRTTSLISFSRTKTRPRSSPTRCITPA